MSFRFVVFLRRIRRVCFLPLPSSKSKIHKLKPRFGDQKMAVNGAELLRSLFLNHDESSNG